MNMLHNTKLWLLIIAVMHTVMGGGGTYATYGMDSLAIVGFFSIVGLYLFYAALMVEGQAQARLAAVFCGPVVVWFVLCAGMGLEMFGDPAAPMPASILPIVLWGMPALSGVMGWNMDESATSATAEA
jgi:peptidoglycan/LPS O-acetylase OafA/YrhL